jgi:hypothetical protein
MLVIVEENAEGRRVRSKNKKWRTLMMALLFQGDWMPAL